MEIKELKIYYLFILIMLMTACDQKAYQNQNNFELVEKGMTTDEVIKIMGTPLEKNVRDMEYEKIIYGEDGSSDTLKYYYIYLAPFASSSDYYIYFDQKNLVRLLFHDN